MDGKLTAKETRRHHANRCRGPCCCTHSRQALEPDVERRHGAVDFRSSSPTFLLTPHFAAPSALWLHCGSESRAGCHCAILAASRLWDPRTEAWQLVLHVLTRAKIGGLEGAWDSTASSPLGFGRCSWTRLTLLQVSVGYRVPRWSVAGGRHRARRKLSCVAGGRLRRAVLGGKARAHCEYVDVAQSQRGRCAAQRKGSGAGEDWMVVGGDGGRAIRALGETPPADPLRPLVVGAPQTSFCRCWNFLQGYMLSMGSWPETALDRSPARANGPSSRPDSTPLCPWHRRRGFCGPQGLESEHPPDARQDQLRTNFLRLCPTAVVRITSTDSRPSFPTPAITSHACRRHAGK